MSMQKTHLPFWIALTGFSFYFVLLLMPKFNPAIGASEVIFLMLLLLLFIPVLLVLCVWSIGALTVSEIRKRPLGGLSRIIVQLTIAAVLSFAGFLAAFCLIPNPSSDLIEFDRSVWLDPASSEYVDGDITPRQKMLADLVAKLPGRDRQELEEMLGPSLNTELFQFTGEYLIYETGPEPGALFPIDSEWLVIWLDDTGSFKRYAIKSN